MVDGISIPGPRVLVHDDALFWCFFIRQGLLPYGFSVRITDDTKVFERYLKEWPNVGAVILDNRLEDGERGLDICRNLRCEGFEEYIGGLSSDVDNIPLFRDSGADDCWIKEALFGVDPIYFGEWFFHSFVHYRNERLRDKFG